MTMLMISIVVGVVLGLCCRTRHSNENNGQDMYGHHSNVMR